VASTPVVTRDIIFRALPGDTIQVSDAATHAVLASYGEGKGGMVRGALRAFAYQRKVRGVALDAVPFRLTAWENGLLTLDDSVTADRIELDTFGPDNRKAFASLLPPPTVSLR
jgi:putative photosynthetic complex assembly protein